MWSPHVLLVIISTPACNFDSVTRLYKYNNIFKLAIYMDIWACVAMFFSARFMVTAKNSLRSHCYAPSKLFWNVWWISYCTNTEVFISHIQLLWKHSSFGFIWWSTFCLSFLFSYVLFLIFIVSDCHYVYVPMTVYMCLYVCLCMFADS